MKIWLLYALLAILLWGLWGFLPKLAIQHISVSGAAVYEILGAIPCALWLAAQTEFRLGTHPLGVGFALATGILGFFAFFCFLQALATGPATLVVAITSLYPAITLVLAIVFLQESLSLRQGIGLMLAMVAVALIAG